MKNEGKKNRHLTPEDRDSRASVQRDDLQGDRQANRQGSHGDNEATIQLMTAFLTLPKNKKMDVGFV